MAAKKRQELESHKNPLPINEGQWVFWRPGIRFALEGGLVEIMIDRPSGSNDSHVEVFTPEECDYFANMLDQYAAAARKCPTAPDTSRSRILAYDMPFDGCQVLSRMPLRFESPALIRVLYAARRYAGAATAENGDELRKALREFDVEASGGPGPNPDPVKPRSASSGQQPSQDGEATTAAIQQAVQDVPALIPAKPSERVESPRQTTMDIF